MKVYRFNDNYEKYFGTEDEAIDFLIDYLHIRFTETDTVEETSRQIELKSILLEVYFTISEVEEDEEYEDDTDERQREYRKMQGF